jgi:hypothetical protein
VPSDIGSCRVRANAGRQACPALTAIPAVGRMSRRRCRRASSSRSTTKGCAIRADAPHCDQRSRRPTRRRQTWAKQAAAAGTSLGGRSMGNLAAQFQRRLFSKLHRFRQQAINAATQEDRGDRHDVRNDVLQAFGTKLATLKENALMWVRLRCICPVSRHNMKLDERFLGSNHIRRPRRVCRTRYG